MCSCKRWALVVDAPSWRWRKGKADAALSALTCQMSKLEMSEVEEFEELQVKFKNHAGNFVFTSKSDRAEVMNFLSTENWWHIAAKQSLDSNSGLLGRNFEQRTKVSQDKAGRWILAAGCKLGWFSNLKVLPSKWGHTATKPLTQHSHFPQILFSKILWANGLWVCMFQDTSVCSMQLLKCSQLLVLKTMRYYRPIPKSTELTLEVGQTVEILAWKNVNVWLLRIVLQLHVMICPFQKWSNNQSNFNFMWIYGQ